MSPHGWVRRVAGIVLIAMLTGILAACVRGSGKPTATPVPTRPVTAPTAALAPTPRAAASPLASPYAARAGASPVAAANGASTVTREQLQAQIRAAFPMEQVGQKGGTVVLGESSDISTLNPMLLFDSGTNNILGTMFEPLVGLSPVDGRPVPALADSWEVAPDGVTYTFHLNKQAKWHDGVDVTADDVAFSFDAALNPNTGFIATTLVNETVAAYRVIDPDTFEMTARDRFVSFLFNGPGGIYIVPKHIWENIDVSAWSFDGGSTGLDPSRVVGTGPFKFKEWVQGDHVTVVRNDAYYDVAPNIDALTLSVQPDAEAAVIALQGGETDIMEIIPPAQTQTVIDTPGRKVAIYDFYQITYFGMNLDPETSPFFQDKAVRQALFYGLDRDAITQNIYFGFGEPAVGTQPKLSPAYAPDRMTPAYTYDPTKAKELLAQAGWVDSDGNGTVDKGGQEFEIDFVYNGGDATVEQVAAYIKEAWKQIGVKAKLESVDLNTFNARLKAHDFDTFLNASGLTPDGDQGQLFSCTARQNGFNVTGYCNSEWDRLQELQRREFDPATRTELLIRQSQIIWDDLPIGPIRFGIARTGYNTRLHNFYPNGYGFLWSLSYVWAEPAS